MVERPQLFDVCIVCALYEEASKLIDEFQARCGIAFVTAFSSLNQYEHRWATIQNHRGEPLTVLVSWLSASGPVRAGLDLKPLLQEFQPRFAAMTGFCAGYKDKVHLGDLVVAEYAYFLEEGKILDEPDGQRQYQPEMKTVEPAERVIQYAKGFEGWQEPVSELKSRLLHNAEQVNCHIAPVASSMAVHADNPFPWLVEYRNRKTIALDMEAATFYLALRDSPDMHGLVVKGVADYADSQKNDGYHDYAARASAVYMLHFIQTYVNEQTMPRRPEPERIVTKTQEFDVFLCYNHLDREEVEVIGRQLQKERINPWFDAWESPSEQPWQRKLEEQIAYIKSAAIFIGAHGIRNWPETEAFLRDFVSRNRPIIPAFLKNAPPEADTPHFLQEMAWVDFRNRHPDPLERLIWNIRGGGSSRPTNVRVTYQPSREGNKGTIIFVLRGIEYTLEYLRRDNITHQIFTLQWHQQDLVRLVLPFATLKPLEKYEEFHLDDVPCLFTVKMSAITSIIRVKLEVGEEEVFRT